MSVADEVDDQSAAAGAAKPGEGSEHQPDGGIEARARRMGWRPETEYRGPKDKWVPAEDFVQTAEENFPMLRDRVRRLDDDLAKRDRTITDLTKKFDEVTQVLGEFSEHNRTLAERTYARARREIIAEMKTAVKEGDTEAFEQRQQQLEELDATKPKPALEKKPVVETPASRAEPQISAVAKRWIDSPDNAWFHSNQRMNAFATAAHADNMREGMTEAESLEAVSTEVRDTFPKQFEKENPLRRAPGAAAAPSAGGPLPPKKKGKTFADLPPQAQKQCDRFVGQIKGFTREKYVADYDWSQADDETE